MLNFSEKQRINVIEIKCLISIFSVRRIDGMRNFMIRGKWDNKLFA